MDLISTLRYAAQKKKEEEEAAARSAAEAEADPAANKGEDDPEDPTIVGHLPG
jgi:hypothetical protein